jgi:hypothetical protein
LVLKSDVKLELKIGDNTVSTGKREGAHHPSAKGESLAAARSHFHDRQAVNRSST